MQIRTITVDYARPRGYDVGYRAENNFTELSLPVPAELEGADSYRVYFESTVGEYLQTELLTPTDGYVTVKITSDIVPEPGNMAAQLVAFADGEIVGYAPMITGTAKVSIPDGTERFSHSLAAEIALNTAARHTHANKSVLDKFAETDGKPTYSGKEIGGGGGASTAEDVSYTNTQLPNVANVKTALDELVPKSHTHATGTNITLADNTEYRFTDVTTLTLTYPTGKFECWMRLTFAASGNITVTLPADTEYLGATPNFKNGETWELSFKDKVLAAKKVGDDDKDAGGENGVTPHIGENGNWYIGSTDTGKPSRGENGVTPHIGDNGNWYIGSTDTGKPSRGVAGVRGDKGNTGAAFTYSDFTAEQLAALKGAKGDRGDTGATGADGKTPVKGTDYWTESDKQEIVNDVIAALPDGTEVSY
jgi:hypothetical protein